MISCSFLVDLGLKGLTAAFFAISPVGIDDQAKVEVNYDGDGDSPGDDLVNVVLHDLLALAHRLNTHLLKLPLRVHVLACDLHIVLVFNLFIGLQHVEDYGDDHPDEVGNHELPAANWLVIEHHE